jgi:hypothetical protein
MEVLARDLKALGLYTARWDKLAKSCVYTLYRDCKSALSVLLRCDYWISLRRAGRIGTEAAPVV